MTGLYEETKRSFLEESAWLRFSSPLFSALARASADDSDMLELGSATRNGQSAGMLLPIVVHYLLLKSPESKLSRYFASLTDTPEPVEDAFPAFREFCLDRRSELTELLARHTVNTNLVERSSSILATLAYVSGLTQQPLTLVEICCSAGLNLVLDEYHYDFGATGQLGNTQSPVQLTCTLIGRSRPPIRRIPQIVQRVGVDLVKVDPSDRLDQLWMQATLFPEWKVEREHLDAALSVRAAHPLRMIEGSALEALPALLPELPGTVCVLATHCMGQWSEEAKGQLDDILSAASRERDIHRVGIDRIHQEPPAAVRERLAKLAAAGVPLSQKSLPSRIEHTWYMRSDARTHFLGQADGCGAWIDWQGPS